MTVGSDVLLADLLRLINIARTSDFNGYLPYASLSYVADCFIWRVLESCHFRSRSVTWHQITMQLWTGRAKGSKNKPKLTQAHPVLAFLCRICIMSYLYQCVTSVKCGLCTLLFRLLLRYYSHLSGFTLTPAFHVIPVCFNKNDKFNLSFAIWTILSAPLC